MAASREWLIFCLVLAAYGLLSIYGTTHNHWPVITAAVIFFCGVEVGAWRKKR